MNEVKEGAELKQLGSNTTEYKYEKPSSKILECFTNKFPNSNYEVALVFPEFTSLCPKTGQPDFGTIEIIYAPGTKCVESKSLKLYLFSYRNQGTFMESITNQILEDFVKAVSPLGAVVTGKFAPRGGVEIIVTAEYVAVDEMQNIHDTEKLQQIFQ